MSKTNSQQASGDHANELYWGSDRSVNDLAEDLNLSKGALYALIEPLPAGLDCPECGGEMQYANRTARDRGIVTCAECELEEEETLVRIESGDDSVLSGSSGFGTDARTLAGTALLGAAAGFVLARLIDRGD
ncbi:MAG TPA: hypothetical protein VJ925_05355 [Longimicrobiales bacterium]|nr:hypothetical protein [Longimicrobiales bacterium]